MTKYVKKYIKLLQSKVKAIWKYLNDYFKKASRPKLLIVPLLKLTDSLMMWWNKKISDNFLYPHSFQ